MKFCQSHWDELRQAIDDRGLSHLVAKDGVAAAKRLVFELEGTDKPDDYDPLMAANWMISGRVLEEVGLVMMMGDYCPLCMVEDEGQRRGQRAGLASEWIKSCTDSVREYCVYLGLIEK